ncbi:MAG: 2-oxo acid dehydrogenase subunit E2 [Chloroflexi bacterium]|nr:2-oxo acid dehydrogenase subunit E2 [Chloroflexota bacterium]
MKPLTGTPVFRQKTKPLTADVLADKANRGQLQKDEMEGGTFTISNMGMLGVESFGALVTPPQAAVLAVGTVKGEVIVDDQGEPAVAPIMLVGD